MNETRYPLYWPEGRPRTSSWNRETARFETTFARARDEIVRQIELMVGRYASQQREANLILSTNVPLRNDGLPLAGKKAPEDPGVAVYFKYKGRRVCFACDRWKTVEHNMQAIAKTIDALRGIARWGTGDMLEAAFRGFEALPGAQADGWRDVLGLPPGTRDRAAAEAAYKRLRSSTHPDRHGGSEAAFTRVQRAWEQAQGELS